MNYYNEIKNKFIDHEGYKRIKDYSKNRNELETYYEVGKLLVEAQGGEARAKYGNGLIKVYSRRLTLELNDKKYSYRNLMNMRKFYLKFSGEKVNALRSQLSWSHYRELLVLNDINEINYYINLSIRDNLSYRQLHDRIKSKEYVRLDDNTKNKLMTNDKLSIKDEIKHPIIIKNKYNTNDITEKMLKNLILENIEDFLNELGNGFSFIKSEYKIKVGNEYNYIDLLLFNYIYNCFIVVELKVTKLRKEHIGQIEIYMNYIDKNINSVTHDKTIGIIIAKRDNKFMMEYCSDKRIFNTIYELI